MAVLMANDLSKMIVVVIYTKSFYVAYFRNACFTLKVHIKSVFNSVVSVIESLGKYFLFPRRSYFDWCTAFTFVLLLDKMFIASHSLRGFMLPVLCMPVPQSVSRW